MRAGFRAAAPCCPAGALEASRSAAARAFAPRAVISLITDKICTSERNPQRQIRGTLSRVPQKRSSAEICKRKNRASASRRSRAEANYSELRASYGTKFENLQDRLYTFFGYFVLLRDSLSF